MITNLWNLLIKDLEDTLRHVTRAVLSEEGVDKETITKRAQGLVEVAEIFQVMSVCICLCVSMCVCRCGHLCVCLGMHACAWGRNYFVSLCACACAHGCAVGMCACVRLCACLHPCACVQVHPCLHMLYVHSECMQQACRHLFVDWADCAFCFDSSWWAVPWMVATFVQ